MDKKTLKIKSTTNVKSLAGSVIMSVEEGLEVELRAIGAGAVNQMIKALAIARGVLSTKGKDLYIQPGFSDVKVDNDETRTIIIAQVVIM